MFSVIEKKAIEFLLRNNMYSPAWTDDYKIRIVKNHDRYDVESLCFADLIITIKDHEKLVELINTPDVLDCIRCDFMYILKHTDDDILRKDVFDNYQRYGLDDTQRKILINYFSSDEIKLEIIKNWKEYELLSFGVYRIIESLKSKDMKKKVLENIDSFGIDRNNEDFVGFFVTIVMDLDDEFKKNVLINYEEHNLQSFYIIKILRSISDNKFKKYVLENYEKFGLYRENVSQVIASIKDDELKKDMLENPNKYDFDESDLVVIALSLENDKDVLRFINDFYEKSNNNRHKTIDLSPGMSIGIEIESVCSNYSDIERCMPVPKWHLEEEVSLGFDGCEIVSPILYPSKETEDDIYKMCFVLNNAKHKITESCGGHIHFGADFLGTDVEAFKNLVEIFSNTEDILYLISNEKGDLSRDNVFIFSEPISGKIEEALKNGCVSFDDISSIEAFANEMNVIQKSRYSSINFCNLGCDKNTIEFRLSNGTLNGDTWIENINLFGSIIEVSKTLADIKRKEVSELTEDDQIKLFLFERLSDETITEEEKLEALLNLAIKKDNIKTYLERYKENKKLIDGTFIESELSSGSSDKPIKVTKKDHEKERLIEIGYEKLLELAFEYHIEDNCLEDKENAKTRR